MSPLISVVMAVYNRAALVGETIQSILDQTFDHFEFIIVDDGSTDQSVAVIRQYRDPRIRLIQLPENRGHTVARNIGNEAARGAYTAVIDSDDIALPQRLEKQLAFMEAHPEVGLCGCSAHWIDEVGQRQGAWQAIGDPAVCHANLVFGMSFHHATWLVRRAIYEQLAYRTEWEPAADWDFMAETAHNTTVAGLRDILMLCRDHPGRISRRRKKEQDSKNMLVIQRVFERIGLHWTPMQLSAWYNKFVRFDAGNPDNPHVKPDELEALAELLSQLLQANQRSGYMDQQALQTLLARRWWSVCRRAAVQGLSIFRLYRSSPARWRGLARLAHDARMLSLCLGLGRKVRLG